MKTENMTVSQLTGAYCVTSNLIYVLLDHPEWTLNDWKEYIFRLHDETGAAWDIAMETMVEEVETA